MFINRNIRNKQLKILIILLISSTNLFSQDQFVFGNIKTLQTNNPIIGVEIYEEGSSLLLSTTNQEGYFEFFTNKKNTTIVFFSVEYKTEKREIIQKDSLQLDIYLERLSIELNEIQIAEKKK